MVSAYQDVVPRQVRNFKRHITQGNFGYGCSHLVVGEIPQRA